jgi:hypothetical protein
MRFELSPTWQTILAAASPPPAPPPAPHARTKPDITLEMLEALKQAYDTAGGVLRSTETERCSVSVAIRLTHRGLAVRHNYYGNRRWYTISDDGRMLIRTQYDALKKFLTDTL